MSSGRRGIASISSGGKSPRNRNASPDPQDSQCRGVSTSSKASIAKKGTKVLVKLKNKSFEISRRWWKNIKTLGKQFYNDPKIVKVWRADIWDAIVHFVKWAKTGFMRFGTNVRACSILVQKVLKGYPLTIRERRLLVRTTSDTFKLVPFSLFVIVPFAELALPVALRLFPNMLPSTFFDKKYDEVTLARTFKAKEEMAEFWQQVVRQRTEEIFEQMGADAADKVSELRDFQEKLMTAQEYPTLKEILRFNKLFGEELALRNMTPAQLQALSKMLGITQASWAWPGHLRVQLRHHITQLRREDRDYMWEGIESLNRQELINACQKRAIRFHEVSEDEMRKDLARWLELSASNKDIQTSVLLWIQSFYMKAGETPEEVQEKAQLQVDEETVEKVQKKKEEDDDANVLRKMLERQKEKTSAAEQKLEEVRQEIEEIMLESATKEASGESAAQAAPLGCQLEEEQEERERVLKHARQVDETVQLYKDVANRQRDLLDQQLRFLRLMRDNKPCVKRDADMILLDQTIRVQETINSFEKSLEDIEAIITRGAEGVPKHHQLNVGLKVPVMPKRSLSSVDAPL